MIKRLFVFLIALALAKLIAGAVIGHFGLANERRVPPRRIAPAISPHRAGFRATPRPRQPGVSRARARSLEGRQR